MPRRQTEQARLKFARRLTNDRFLEVDTENSVPIFSSVSLLVPTPNGQYALAFVPTFVVIRHRSLFSVLNFWSS